MGSINKSNRKPSLSQTHKDKRKEWAEDNVKTEVVVSKVVFIEKPRLMLDRPDGWSRQRSTSHRETTARWEHHDMGWNL